MSKQHRRLPFHRTILEELRELQEKLSNSYEHNLQFVVILQLLLKTEASLEDDVQALEAIPQLIQDMPSPGSFSLEREIDECELLNGLTLEELREDCAEGLRRVRNLITKEAVDGWNELYEHQRRNRNPPGHPGLQGSPGEYY